MEMFCQELHVERRDLPDVWADPSETCADSHPNLHLIMKQQSSNETITCFLMKNACYVVSQVPFLLKAVV